VFLHAALTWRDQDDGMDFVAVLLGVVMFAILLTLVAGIDRI
jgi:hypothetical protein